MFVKKNYSCCGSFEFGMGNVACDELSRVECGILKGIISNFYTFDLEPYQMCRSHPIGDIG